MPWGRRPRRRSPGRAAIIGQLREHVKEARDAVEPTAEIGDRCPTSRDKRWTFTKHHPRWKAAAGNVHLNHLRLKSPGGGDSFAMADRDDLCLGIYRRVTASAVT